MQLKAKIELQVRPFTVPNFVIAENPNPDAAGEFTKEGGFPLSMIDANTLDRMCDEFRDAVFKKAGKSPPPTCEPER